MTMRFPEQMLKAAVWTFALAFFLSLFETAVMLAPKLPTLTLERRATAIHQSVNG